jgi:hypothetical protein
MTLSLAPNVRYMIVCDEVVKDSQRPGKLTIVGLTSLVTWPSGGTNGVTLERLVILLILTNGRGSGMGKIVCRNEENGDVKFDSPPQPISFEGKDPLAHYGVTFRFHNCHFPAPGVYAVQFLFDDTVVQEQLITVR